jgi:hypothetical protein
MTRERMDWSGLAERSEDRCPFSFLPLRTQRRASRNGSTSGRSIKRSRRASCRSLGTMGGGRLDRIRLVSLVCFARRPLRPKKGLADDIAVWHAVKYYSPHTSLCIIRTSRDHHRTVWAALSMIGSVNGERVLARVVHCSGKLQLISVRITLLSHRLLTHHKRSPVFRYYSEDPARYHYL